MDEKIIESAIDKLGIEFKNLDLTFHKMGNGTDVTSYWPGDKNEDIIRMRIQGMRDCRTFSQTGFLFYQLRIS